MQPEVLVIEDLDKGDMNLGVTKKNEKEQEEKLCMDKGTPDSLSPQTSEFLDGLTNLSDNDEHEKTTKKISDAELEFPVNPIQTPKQDATFDNTEETEKNDNEVLQEEKQTVSAGNGEALGLPVEKKFDLRIVNEAEKDDEKVVEEEEKPEREMQFTLMKVADEIQKYCELIARTTEELSADQMHDTQDQDMDEFAELEDTEEDYEEDTETEEPVETARKPRKRSRVNSVADIVDIIQEIQEAENNQEADANEENVAKRPRRNVVKVNYMEDENEEIEEDDPEFLEPEIRVWTREEVFERQQRVDSWTENYGLEPTNRTRRVEWDYPCTRFYDKRMAPNDVQNGQDFDVELDDPTIRLSPEIEDEDVNDPFENSNSATELLTSPDDASNAERKQEPLRVTQKSFGGLQGSSNGILKSILKRSYQPTEETESFALVEEVFEIPVLFD